MARIVICIILASLSAVGADEHELALLNAPAFRDLQHTQPQPAVKLQPLSLTAGSDVFVSVSGMSAAAADDWVGLYSPFPVSDITSTVPIKYAMLSKDASYLLTGNSTLRFTLFNTRAAVGAVVFRGGLYAGVALASSPVPATFIDVSAPHNIHVAATSTFGLFVVTWTSVPAAQPMARWRTSTGSFVNVTATTRALQRSDLCGTPARGVGWHDLGQLNSAVIGFDDASLSGNALEYVVGDAASNTFSTLRTLQVPLRRGDVSRPTRIITFGDLGRSGDDDSRTWGEYGGPAINATRQMLRDIAIVNYDAVVHFGDISYANGYLSSWDAFLAMIEPVASRLCWMIGVGNHESDHINSASFWNVSDAGGECGAPTDALFPLPSPATRTTPWYSVDIGIIHLVMMSSEHNFTTGSPQWLWLQGDLAAVDRRVSPWVVLTLHRPMYIDSTFGGSPTGDIEVAALMRQHLELLFLRHRVNLAMYGHTHSVQRLSAAFANRTVQRSTAVVEDGNITVHLHQDPQATVHMVAGTGGASFWRNNAPTPPEWSERVMYEWGYAHLTAVNSTHLYWEWQRSSDAVVMDRMRIVQTNPFQPWILPTTDLASDLPAGVVTAIAVSIVVVSSIAAVACLRRVWKVAASMSYARLDTSVRHNNDAMERQTLKSDPSAASAAVADESRPEEVGVHV